MINFAAEQKNTNMKYPIGMQSFDQIRDEGFVYVDKTALVYDLVTNGKIYFLSRPRRFGKSLLLSTLENYFLGRKDLFRGLAIDSLEKEWAEYPVFHLDFNAINFTKPGTLEMTLDKFLEDGEKRYNINPDTSEPGLRFNDILVAAHEKTGRRAVVLIDEYDKPLLDVMNSDIPSPVVAGEVKTLEDYNRNILKGFYSVFKLADKCLYIAKNKGRNCYIIYKPELHDIVFTKNRENENKLATGQLYNDAAEAEYEIVTAIQNIKKGDDIKPVLEMLAEYLGLNSISIYGKDLKLFCSTGDKNQNFREEALKKADYFSFFNQFGYLHLDNTNVLDSTAQEKFSLYTNNSIGSTLEVLCGEGKEKVLFCFDVFKPARTFPKEKITFMLMISRMIYKQSL